MPIQNLDYLKPGAAYPPYSERPRNTRYLKHKKLFDNLHRDLHIGGIENSSQGFKTTYVDNNSLADRIININWFSRLSLFWADYVFNTKPIITTGDDNKDKFIATFMDEMLAELKKSIVDLSRYGDSVVTPYWDNGPRIQTISPAGWIPIVDPENVHRPIGHSIGRMYVLSPEQDAANARIPQGLTIDAYMNDGSIYKFTGRVSGNSINTIEKTLVGMAPPGVKMIIPLSLNTLSDTIYGRDDYVDIIPVIKEIENRISRVSDICDRHSNPNMSGPQSLVESIRNQPASGAQTLASNEDNFNASSTVLLTEDNSKYFPVGEGEPEPKYLVWESNLEANFQMIDTMSQAMFSLSGASPGFFNSASQDQVPGSASGSALGHLTGATHLKGAKIREIYENCIKDIIVSLSIWGGINSDLVGQIDRDEIDIIWKPGEGDEEKSTRVILEQVSKGVLDKETAVQMLQGISKKNAEAMVENSTSTGEEVTMPNGIQRERNDDES